MNMIIFMGRLCDEPEIRYISGENANCIAHFRLAVDKRFKNKNDSNAPTADFFRITAFGKQAEFAEKYLHKGTKIVMSGRIENNNYTDKNGNKVFSDQMIAENIEFAESKRSAEDNGVNTSNNSAPAAAPVVDDDLNNLPFKS